MQMADRKTTPDILGSVLGPVVDESAIIRQQLRYDYDQLGAVGPAVQEHAVAIKSHERKANEAVIEAGRHLIAVKESLPHGQWEDWLRVEFSMTDRTARTMMTIAERFDGKTEKISVLGTSVLGLLASPSVPDAVVEKVIDVAATEGKISVTRAKQIIQHQKFLDGKSRPQPKRDDAAEDTWRPAQEARAALSATANEIDKPLMEWTADDWAKYEQAGKPLMEVIKTDEELAADEAARQAQAAADPYDHTHGAAIINDLAAQEAQRLAAAAADVAFGMAPTRTQVLAKLLQDVMDAIPELSKLTGKAGDCILLQSAATKVYGALVATRAPAAPATDLPDDLKAHGWQLRQMRGKWIAFVQPEGEEDEIRTNIPREKLADVIGDARYLDKQLRIGA